jgi:mannosidase alpha-like ER degradation enhancer 1
VNLKYGVLPGETSETCTAGAGTLLLEFGMLSRLTGNYEYEQAALQAVRQLWNMRSNLDLVGNTLDIYSGKWIRPQGSIGAGIDSFYEYLVKSYILFGNEEFMDMFNKVLNNFM